jgi:hypothetical protein
LMARRSCWASMASPISTPFTPASMITRCSSVSSTSSPKVATIWKLPLHLRKINLERLLARRPEGMFINPFERGEIGPDLFRSACQMGLEGLPPASRATIRAASCDGAGVVR